MNTGYYPGTKTEFLPGRMVFHCDKFEVMLQMQEETSGAKIVNFGTDKVKKAQKRIDIMLWLKVAQETQPALSC